MSTAFRCSALLCLFSFSGFLWARDSADLVWEMVRPLNGEPARSAGQLTWNQPPSAVKTTTSWQLFFNFPWVVDPLPKGSPFQISHVNGDLWKITPTAQFRAEDSVKALSWMIQFEGAALNTSLSPLGPFWRPAADQTALPLSIELRQPANHFLVRGPKDVLPVESAELRYARNQAWSQIGGTAATPAGVFPSPKQQTIGQGQLKLARDPQIGYAEGLAGEARFLADQLNSQFGWQAKLVAGTAKSSDILLLQDPQPKTSGASAEGYRLQVKSGAPIRITGQSPAGAFYGIQSLLSLMPARRGDKPPAELAIREIEVSDAPRFAYRGMHLDVARHFHDATSVKRVLDLMAIYKLNRLHFHLTDDEGWRIAIKEFPELTEIGANRGGKADQLQPSFGSGVAAENAGSGFYSRETFVSLLRYAADRHIEVIPEIDMPGHARAAIKAIELSHEKHGDQGARQFKKITNLRDPKDTSSYRSVQGWTDNVICVCSNDSYRFLSMVIEDLEEMYREAGQTLKVVHAGGDEVPRGVWTESPVCKALMKELGFKETKELFAYFFEQLHKALSERNIRLAGWEEIALLVDNHEGGSEWHFNRNLLNPPARTYVWNDVPGWGREDLAYHLANAGFEVVLASAPHLYFDLAYNKDFHEPGYNWAGFVDTYQVFRFSPLNLYASGATDRMGQTIPANRYQNHIRLSDKGRKNILGLQGQLWSETVTTRADLEYMLLPKLLGLAERAWAPQPGWEMLAPSAKREQLLNKDWHQFATRLGQQELKRLDAIGGGYQYRLPLPGAVIRNGELHANIRFPGLAIRYTTDGSQPTADSARYTEPIRVENKTVNLAAFDQSGRKSRTVTVAATHKPLDKGVPQP